MRHILSLFALSILASAPAFAAGDTLRVERVRAAGPFAITSPLIIDSLDATQTKYSADKLIDTPLPLSALRRGSEATLSTLPTTKGAIHLVGFPLTATTYVKDAKLIVRGAKHYKVYADGAEANGSISLAPGRHDIAVKFMADSSRIAIEAEVTGGKLTTPIQLAGNATSGSERRAFTMAENLQTRVPVGASLSASGRWAMAGWRWYDATNRVLSETMLCDLKTGQKRPIRSGAAWMPRSEKYVYTDRADGHTRLIAADPLTGATSTLCEELPSDYYYLSPTEDFAIVMQTSEGPKKEDGVFEILSPDDRQPTWRSRYTLSRLDLATGFVRPLVRTWRPITVADISEDGRELLFSVSSDTLTRRPTTRSTYIAMNLETLATDTLVANDGFIASATYAGPQRIAFTASTEAFGGIGKRVPEGSTPNMYDYHLYIMERQSHKVTPATADDITSIENVEYSPGDRTLYYTAQHCDSTLLYRLDLATLRSRLIAQPVEDITGFSLSRRGGNIIYYGSSATRPYEVRTINGKGASSLLLAPNAELYKDIALGTVRAWSFRTSRGYDVTGHYYLPADFDATKKYPVIVHYYGGCSPTSRRFGNGSHYPAHLWNALGYIVLIVNPSGASGFGQEWASRHVNTMGEGPAEDIIDATRQFARDLPAVDSLHIGCVSASYGGFMTQYMLTKDNPFACGISHAGISSHTSYWGEGYWGYSYSEVSAANSFPWTRKDLFVDRSPLYNADKITKPLLFTHGTADTNVPIGESIQMYTALRLLGRPTAFVEVEGENHGIMDPVKRTKWINTMLAWFQRYLKDDPSWWDAIYTPKKL